MHEGDEREAHLLLRAGGAGPCAPQRQTPHTTGVDDHHTHHDRGKPLSPYSS